MIDKEKTLHRAISRYHDIFPARGKHSLDECFFRLRGEHVFVFVTKDKKVHTMKADVLRPVSVSAGLNRDALHSLFQVLNKPIIVRELIVRKPVGAWVINLFPSPGISRLPNADSMSGPARIHQSARRDAGNIHAQPFADRNPQGNATSAYAFPLANRLSNGLPGEPEGITAQQYPSQHGTTTHRYEILATGRLPIRPAADWMPAPDKGAESACPPRSAVPTASTATLSDRWYMPPCTPKSGRCEILATGCLPIRLDTRLILE